MPERLDRVLVSTRRTTVEIPWASRDALLAEIRHLDSARPVIAAFEAVGASRPVELDRAGQALLVEAINVWACGVGAEALPDGISPLRNQLIDELHDAANEPTE